MFSVPIRHAKINTIAPVRETLAIPHGNLRFLPSTIIAGRLTSCLDSRSMAFDAALGRCAPHKFYAAELCGELRANSASTSPARTDLLK